MNQLKFLTLICGLLFLCGLISISCTNVDFNNPLDKNGTSVDTSDVNHNHIWDIDEDDDKDGIPNGYEDDDGDGVFNKDDPDSELHVKDTIPPVFNKPSHDTDTIAVTVEEKDSTVFNKRLNEIINSVSATDNKDGLKVEVTQAISRIATGVYPITYTARDLDGNTVSITRYVNVYQPSQKDITPPLITTFGKDTINVGDPIIDGATAFDVGDNATVAVTKTGTVDVNKAGSYSLTYTAVDKSGNKATLTRIIVVKEGAIIDDGKPVITLKGKDTVTVYSKSEFVEPGYTAYDKEDKDISDSVKVDTTEWENASGPGTYQIHYKVQDSDGNNAETKTRFVKWLSSDGDRTKPVISVEGGITEVKMIVGNSWALLEPKVTANDNKDGPITNKITKVSDVDSSKAGTYYVTYSVKDNAGNEASLRITVIVTAGEIDITKPVITMNGKNPDTVALKEDGTYTDAGATATDNGKSINVTKSGSVDMGKAGSYTLTYTATDASGNSASVERKVVVIEGTVIGDLLKKYNVPASSPLPSLPSKAFTKVTIDGTGGPSLSNVKDMQFNWSLERKIMDYFAISTNDGKPGWSVPLTIDAGTLASPNPTLTLESTGFTGLDGEYYVTMYETDKLVWVEKNGKFAIIWE